LIPAWLVTLFICVLLYGILIFKILIMSKIVKRIRIHKDINDFMEKHKIKKQYFIETAIREKLEKDFNYKVKIPF